MPIDYRYDEFRNLDLSILISGEAITVPSSERGESHW